MKSRRRLLEAFARIADSNLRSLVAELVHIRAQHEGERAPLTQYKHKIDAYATEYQDELDASYLTPSEHEAIELRDGSIEIERPEQTDNGIVTLKSVVLSNFGSYFGEHEIVLEPEGNRNVTALVGSNGDGKSTVFYALNWALYGEEYLLELRRDKQRELHELINRRAVMEAAENEGTVEAFVLLHFSTRERNYYVRRSVSARPRQTASGVSTAGTSTGVQLRRVDPNGNHEELLASALGSLLSALPSHVKEFYLFDGERINRFVSPGSQALIRKAIRRVIGIEALEQTADDLSKVSSAFRSEARTASSGELSEIQQKIEDAGKRLALSRSTFDKRSGEAITLKSRIDEIDEILLKTPDTRPLQVRRSQLERQLADIFADEQRTAFEMRDLAADASLLLAGDSIKTLVSELDSRRQAGVIPGPQSKQLIRDLLEIGGCICGTPLEPGTAARARLESELANLASREQTSETLLELFIEITSLSGTLMEQATQLERRRAELARIQKRRREHKLELTEVSNQLASFEDVDRSGWEQERRAKNDQLINTKAALIDLERSIEAFKNEARSLKEKEAAQTKSQEKAMQFVHKARWSEAAEESLRRVFTDFAALARSDVEATTSALWQKMLPNVSPYSVHVSEDFELRVFNKAGEPAIQQLAMGQQQCLGLAFITAVAQVAESRPPLIIDMPFGRLGAEVASSVAATLPTLTNQLILFVLPETEWNSQTRAAIAPFLAREYWIRYSPTELTTKFVDPYLGAA